MGKRKIDDFFKDDFYAQRNRRPLFRRSRPYRRGLTLRAYSILKFLAQKNALPTGVEEVLFFEFKDLARELHSLALLGEDMENLAKLLPPAPRERILEIMEEARNKPRGYAPSVSISYRPILWALAIYTVLVVASLWAVKIFL